MHPVSLATGAGDTINLTLQPTAQSTPPPTAIIFGWFGASHRNVAKYAASFLAMRYHVAQTIAPAHVVFAIRPRTHAQYTFSVLEALHAHHEHIFAGGTVFVFMSNAGAFCATSLAHMFSGKDYGLLRPAGWRLVKQVRNSIAAVMFDSGPCYIYVHFGARAMADGLGVTNPVAKWLIAAFFSLLLFVQSLFVGNFPLAFWDSVRTIDYKAPELYAYSTADHLLDSARLQKAIDERRYAGRDIRIYSVDDADHVSLLKKHPDRYVQTVREVNDWGVNAYRKRLNIEQWVYAP